MRLTGRFIAALTCTILIVLGVSAFVRVRREVALFEDDIRRDTRLLGRALAGAVVRIWTTVGEAEALDLVDDADERESDLTIRWLWLDPGGAGGADQSGLSEDVRKILERGGDVADDVSQRGAGDDSLSTFVAVALPDGRRAAIELRESRAAERRYVTRTIVQAALATGILVVFCGLLATGLGIFFVGRPVRRLVDQARRIGSGDLSPGPESPRRDELGELSRELNAMCERLRDARAQVDTEIASRLATQEQLRHADRLTTVGKLAAGIAHEVGTPLNVITGYAQLVRDEAPPDSSTAENAMIIAEQAHRVAHIIRQLLDFARQRTPRMERCDLVGIVRRSVSLLESLAQKQNVVIEVSAGDVALEAAVDRGQVEQVLANLLVNSIQAMPSGGTVEVGMEVATGSPPAAVIPAGRSPVGTGTFACISVRDGGSGIPAEALPHIFEPFFTTKEVGEGTGLGLSVAYGIVKEHGGWIDVQSEPGKGARFAVYLPLESS